MSVDTLTDARIAELLKVHKVINNPNAKIVDRGKYKKVNYKAYSEHHEFTIYTRQNILIENDFSCGLIWIAPNGESVTLVRYNGSNHSHGNKLEGDKSSFVCHKHIATERYIQSGKKPEGFAEATQEYNTLDGATYCLLKDCNIEGIERKPDAPSLFETNATG